MALRESHRRGCVKVELPVEDRSLQILSSEIQNDDTPARVQAITSESVEDVYLFVRNRTAF